MKRTRIYWSGARINTNSLFCGGFFVRSGLVAFRQHLQNLARTKGILELNKVQMLVEQMGSGDGATMDPLGPQHHLHNLLEVSLAAQSHKNTPSSFTFKTSFSPSTVLTPCHQERKKKKNGHPGCCVTPGEAANCGLFTVSRPLGAWGLEPRLKWIQSLLKSPRLTQSSGWNYAGTKRQAHID